MVHKERKIDKIKIYKLLILLLFLSNIFSYPITKKYTYYNDIVFSNTNFVGIMANPQICKPYIGSIDLDFSQTFIYSFKNSTDEENKFIVFWSPLPEFRCIEYFVCFSENYPNNLKYQNISNY